VQESGVALGLQGTVAGVGDLVEARKLDWGIAGYEGNRRHAINREHYRVQAVRPDGALEVAVVEGRTPDGDVLGERLMLPPSYVAEHLALGYASTVHAAQGTTVDTTHTVVTSRTGPAGLYVGMSRGREVNTAHVATLTGVDDPAQGQEGTHTLHRDPVAVLARALDTTEQADAANRSAVATATEAAAQAGSVRTAAELLADAAHLAATERTATWLDQLTHDGVIRPDERARIAAEDGAASLTRILRRAELAGHDPHQVLHDAVAGRPFDGARNLSNVVYSRIRHEYRDRLDPVGETFTDWKPAVDNPEWRDYLDALASAADQRAAELGREAAEQAAPWAIEAFGPVPTDSEERSGWERQAGSVAAVRELADHTGADDALGPAPKPGQIEQYAAYRAAWRTLGRPEIDREELELSDGQLRVRVRAHEREATWAPRYVGNELAGTHHATATYRQSAALRLAEADSASEPAEQQRLRAEAAQAHALADTLDARAAELQQLDDARAHWLAHTAGTRAAAERAKAELAARHVDDTEPEQQVTAEEWLAAHRAALAQDEPHRDITETDVRDADLADRTNEDTLDEPRHTQPADVQLHNPVRHDGPVVDGLARQLPEPAGRDGRRPGVARGGRGQQSGKLGARRGRQRPGAAGDP
jgi:hypothetical protein